MDLGAVPGPVLTIYFLGILSLVATSLPAYPLNEKHDVMPIEYGNRLGYRCCGFEISYYAVRDLRLTD